MKKTANFRWAPCFMILTWLPIASAWPDGGYVSQSVAVTADQRAIIIKSGNEISMTLSTGYTGEGDDFGWIIPTPVPPAIEDVSEAGEKGEAAFRLLDAYSAPLFYTVRGCFPAGTEVLTASGPRTIEAVEPGTMVHACDLATGEWTLARVLKRQSFRYRGDMVTIHIGAVAIQATGNHPFFVVSGDRLASRPLPQEVPPEEQGMAELGRWVEARDLREGDMLKARGDGRLAITALSSRQQTAEVFWLGIDQYHNCAVTRLGILVHNAGHKEAGTEETAAIGPVTVYGRVSLEHYEVSILVSAGVSSLQAWLQKNGYPVRPEAQKVLDSYIHQNWAFVAVKLNPSEKRHHENELLPPLTIRYSHSQLIFPLRISSVSTSRTARITLYVIAESTVSSTNFPTATLKFEKTLSKPVVPADYIETCIQKTLADEGRTLIVIRAGEISDGTMSQATGSLTKGPFPEGTKMYLTRVDARMDAAAMSDDIRFALDPKPAEFRVEIWSRAGPPRSSFDRVAVDADGNVYAVGSIHGQATYDFSAGVTATGTTMNPAVLVKYDSSGVPQWARTDPTGTTGNLSYPTRLNWVAVDAGGNMYAVGHIWDTGSCDFGAGVTATATTKNPAVLVKYDSSGVPQWAQTVTPGPLPAVSTIFHSVAVDGGGNVYATRSIYRPYTDSRWGEAVSSSAGLVKYDSSGVPQWDRTVTASNPSSSSSYDSVAVDSGGNVYIAGRISGPGSYDFGGGVTAAGPSLALVKYDSSGTARWARTVAVSDLSQSSSFRSVAVDRGGNVYAAGDICDPGSYDFGGGIMATGTSERANLVLVKYDSSGVPKWARTVNTDNLSMLSSFFSVAADAGGNVYMAGGIWGAGSYDFGGGVKITMRHGGGVLVKYDSSGASRWARTVNADNPSSSSSFYPVAVDAGGNVYMVCGPGPGSYDFGGGVRITLRYQSGVLVKYDSLGTAKWARMVTLALD